MVEAGKEVWITVAENLTASVSYEAQLRGEIPAYVEKFVVSYDRESHEAGNWFWYKQNRAIQYFNLLALSVWWEKFVKQGNQFF